MYYRNYYTQHAPSYLRRLNEKIRSLKLIPSGLSNFEMEYHGDEDFKVVGDANSRCFYTRVANQSGRETR
jgi:hypothetical protein